MMIIINKKKNMISFQDFINEYLSINEEYYVPLGEEDWSDEE